MTHTHLFSTRSLPARPEQALGQLDWVLSILDQDLALSERQQTATRVILATSMAARLRSEQQRHTNLVAALDRLLDPVQRDRLARLLAERPELASWLGPAGEHHYWRN